MRVLQINNESVYSQEETKVQRPAVSSFGTQTADTTQRMKGC